MTMKSDVKS